MRMAYMAIGWEFGKLLYGLAHSIRAKTIVEFGTSFGISTIFLASAIRDNGVGQVITTDFEPAKVERARENLAAAGVEEWVELRIGDARETLSDSPRDIDMVLSTAPRNFTLTCSSSSNRTCALEASLPATTRSRRPGAVPQPYPPSIQRLHLVGDFHERSSWQSPRDFNPLLHSRPMRMFEI